MSKKDDYTIDVISGIDDDIIDSNLKKRFVLCFGKVKLKRRRWIPVVAVVACLCIVSTTLFVLLYDGDDRQVPVYRGMSVSDSVTGVEMLSYGSQTPKNQLHFDINNLSVDSSASNLPASNASAILLSVGNIKEIKKENASKHEDVQTVPSEGDVHTVTAIQEEGEVYYAKKNEDIYILIHIFNPDAFEILSFTLNGVKYSSYMFEVGSDMETLVLKYNIGDSNGLQEYTIDAIKYVDGEHIKDVQMEGDRTVSVYVNDNTLPVNFNAVLSGWSLSLSPTWNDDYTGRREFISLAVYERSIKLFDLSPTDTLIENLPVGKRLVLIATYDNNGSIEIARYVFDTPSESEGLHIVNGVIVGIGICTDTVLYLNHPIGDNAFITNKHIVEVYLGKDVTSVGNSAFQECENLTRVIMSDGVTVLGCAAFNHCMSLKSVVIKNPSIVGCKPYYDNYLAFGTNLKSLSDIYFGGTVEQWNNIESQLLGKYGAPEEIAIHCSDGELVWRRNK